ncbi:MAG: hypothetical protein ACRDKF_14000 [Actinomycetota bacterium]
MKREHEPGSPEEYIVGNREGMEAVVIRIGAGEAQLVLVDSQGSWDRWVYDSIDACTAKAEELGISDVHIGEYPEKTRVRMNAYRRTEDSFAAGAYPEQGVVGPVNAYPENRPRPKALLPEEKGEAEKSEAEERP